MQRTRLQPVQIGAASGDRTPSASMESVTYRFFNLQEHHNPHNLQGGSTNQHKPCRVQLQPTATRLALVGSIPTNCSKPLLPQTEERRGGFVFHLQAIPPGWDFDGTVYVRGRTKVEVQTRNGTITTVAIEAGTTHLLKIRNPWPGRPVDVISGKTGAKIVKGAVGLKSNC